MNEQRPARAQEGGELWVGLVGPIPVSDDRTAETDAWTEATRIAQAAHTVQDLAELASSHPDWRVRYEAVPRLRARFPDNPLTLQVLGIASRDQEPGVRDAATSALGRLTAAEAADLIAERLADADFDVRLSAAMALGLLGDARAPDDAEGWALQSMLDTPRLDS